MMRRAVREFGTDHSVVVSVRTTDLPDDPDPLEVDLDDDPGAEDMVAGDAAYIAMAGGDRETAAELKRSDMATAQQIGALTSDTSTAMGATKKVSEKLVGAATVWGAPKIGETIMQSEVANQVLTSETVQTAAEHAPEAVDKVANEPVTGLVGAGLVLGAVGLSEYATGRTVQNIPAAARGTYNRAADLKGHVTKTAKEAVSWGEETVSQQSGDSEIADESGKNEYFDDSGENDEN